jgi:hypothetical protein
VGRSTGLPVWSALRIRGGALVATASGALPRRDQDKPTPLPSPHVDPAGERRTFAGLLRSRLRESGLRESRFCRCRLRQS